MLVQPGAGVEALSPGGSSDGAPASNGGTENRSSGQRRRPSEFQSTGDNGGDPGYGGDTSFSQSKQGGRVKPGSVSIGDADMDPSRVQKTLDGSQAGDPDADYTDDGDGDGEEQDGFDPNAEPDESDDPQAQAKAKFLEELASELEQGKLPMDKLENMLVKVPGPNGTEEEISLKDLKRGYLRQSDYTRKLESATRTNEQAMNLIQLERARTQSWQDHGSLRRDLAQMGLGDSFERAAFAFAQEQVAFNKLPPQEKERIRWQQQIQQERNQAAQMQRELMQKLQQQQNPQAQQAEVTRHFETQLQQLMPAAFKEFKLGNYPEATKGFLRNIGILYQGGQVTAQLVRDAAQATREELNEYHRLQAEENKRMGIQNRGGALGPRRLSGGASGAANQQQNPNGGRRGRPSQFAGKFNSSGF